MTKAMEDRGLNSLGCTARALQLTANEGVLNQRSISDWPKGERQSDTLNVLISPFPNSERYRQHGDFWDKSISRKEGKKGRDKREE